MNENSKAQEFYHPDLLVIPEDDKAPYLTAYRCEECGKYWFPRLQVCPNCWSENLAKVPINRKGTLYSFTIIRIGQPSMKTPCAVGFVDFPEGVRVCAQIEGEPGELMNSLMPGMEMEVTTGTIRVDEVTNQEIISYKFKTA